MGEEGSEKKKRKIGLCLRRVLQSVIFPQPHPVGNERRRTFTIKLHENFKSSAPVTVTRCLLVCTLLSRQRIYFLVGTPVLQVVRLLVCRVQYLLGIYRLLYPAAVIIIVTPHMADAPPRLSLSSNLPRLPSPSYLLYQRNYILPCTNILSFSLPPPGLRSPTAPPLRG